MKKMLLVSCLLLFPAATYACGSNEYEECYSVCVLPKPFGGCAQEIKDCKCLPKVGGDVGKAGEQAKEAANNAAKEVEKGLENITKEAAIAVNNVAKTLEKADDDIGKNVSKSNEDIKAEIDRAGKDTEQAVSAVGRYMERMGQSVVPALEQAAIRAREGKVIDAVWHLNIAPYQAGSKNAALAMTESSVLNTVAQVAATAYGGPQGAAAYAAWLTYEQTGDAGLAVKVGVIAGAANYAMAKAGHMPSNTEYELMKKTVVTGAIGGTAVAAAGGNEAAVKEAFLKAGAMVVIQDTFKDMTTHDLSGKASEGEPYCVTVATTDCAPPSEAYVRNPDGSLALDDRGVPKLDVSKMDPKRPMVGLKDPKATFNEGNVVMKGISKVPGMNGMAVFHDQWAMKWDMNAFTTPTSIVPAVVLTYWGLGAPYYTDLQKTAVEAKQQDMATLNRMIAPSSDKPESEDTGITTVGSADKYGKPIVPLDVRKNDIVQSYLCNRENMVRAVAVERPAVNDRGLACRVLYASEKSETAPWVAKNDGSYCESKARAFAKKLEVMGFTCNQSAMNRVK